MAIKYSSVLCLHGSCLERQLLVIFGCRTRKHTSASILTESVVTNSRVLTAYTHRTLLSHPRDSHNRYLKIRFVSQSAVCGAIKILETRHN